MDTLFDSQDLGESSTNDLQAGEFAKSSPSPVQGLGAATQTTVDLNDFMAAIDSRLAVK